MTIFVETFIMSFSKSLRLENLKYAIRGPVFDKAQEMQAAGIDIINLNIGNPAPFGFNAPEEIRQDIIANIRRAQGYSHHLGIFPARKAVMHYAQHQGIPDIQMEHIFIGNGVSELIMMTMQALLNEGDEVLIPAPDYPLWTSAVRLAGGSPVHYRCDESRGWQPDLEDISHKVSPRTKAIVVINPNNPTGAVYGKEILQGISSLAEKHKLMVCADEIYDKILYDDRHHLSLASLGKETLYLTYGGLSKNYRAAGFRAGWLILSGGTREAKSYIEGLTLLASMRLCANVLAQNGIQTALGGYQSINDLVAPKGRLSRQRDYAYDRMRAIPGIHCTQPEGALYLFPSIDLSHYDFADDEDFVLKLLIEKHVLLVHGSGFNHTDNHHFRLVFLADINLLEMAFDSMEVFLKDHRR